jgi:hypothetical protein
MSLKFLPNQWTFLLLLFRICPCCGSWFALRFIESRPDVVAQRLDSYRCRKCDRKVEVLWRLPPDVV